MADIGTDITTDVPAPGASGPGYAADIEAILEEVVARLEARVPLGSLRQGVTGEELDLNNTPVQHAEYLGLYEQASAPSGAPFGRFARYNGNVYWVDSAGAVQITAGGVLNSAAVGGITGDYGTGPETVSFAGGSETYLFYDDQAGGGWAIVKARQFDAVDEATGRVVSVRPSASVAASYNFILPPNDPASGVSALTINASGEVALGESATITNLPTFDGGGPKHTAQVEWWSARAIDHNVSAGSASLTGAGALTDAAVYTADFYIKAPAVGRRLVTLAVRALVPAGATCKVEVFRVVDGTATEVGTEANDSGSPGVQTITWTGTETTVATYVYYAKVTFGGVPLANCIIYGLGIGHDYV